MKFEKLTVPTQRELFIKKMQEMILSGELPAHTRIPPERDLAKQMGISRSVVNTGIAILEYQGFLQVINRQGTFVADYKKTASVETLNAIMRLKGDVLTDHDIRSILEIRWALEKLTMRNALNLNENDIERLRIIVENIKTSQSYYEEASHALNFQITLADIGQNDMLGLIITTFRHPCIAMWMRFCNIYGIEKLYMHTRTSWELLQKHDYQGALEWIETFTKEAMDGQYTLYEKDLRKQG